MKDRSIQQLKQHLENLYELKSEYMSNGDPLNIKVISGMIEQKEKELQAYGESGE
ncbi:hypothetical protein [Priestia flexa]|uniref:hypothetical protein n=1 Tax=Priestia flexa TaxID=86664 RepID=UPI0024905349|nr:hypothetical protein [Priestia flexa]